MHALRAVVFDWRGTLAVTLTEQEWAGAARGRLQRACTTAAVQEVVHRLRTAPGRALLDDARIDADAALHRQTYTDVLSRAGFDDALVAALYAVESDPALNPFALDAEPCLRRLARRGVPVAVLSDIHFDIRPAFARAGLDRYVDAFVLSFERGLHKPDPRIFQIALHDLDVAPGQALMVGDRPGFDGAAAEAGMAALLLPPLRSIEDRRLHLVEALLNTTQ